MLTIINLQDGKYTIEVNLETMRVFRCLRYGDKWRDFRGDNLMLALVQEILKARNAADILLDKVERLEREISQRGNE